MTTRQIDDAPAAKHPPHPPGHLPRFVQFLARQAAGVTDGAADAIEQRRPRKPAEIVPRQSRARSWIK